MCELDSEAAEEADFLFPPMVLFIGGVKASWDGESKLDKGAAFGVRLAMTEDGERLLGGGIAFVLLFDTVPRDWKTPSCALAREISSAALVS